jgi:hypothetical protein
VKQFVRIDEDESETLIEKAYIDGYAVGDRILEGVWFEVTIVKNKFVVKPTAESSHYFNGLNKKQWLKAIADHCETNDVFQSDPQNQMDDVICRDTALALDKTKPVAIQVVNSNAFLSSLKKR